MRSTGKQSIAMPRIALQPLVVRNCLKRQEVIESRASHAFFVKNNGSNRMNVSAWAGRNDFSDFSGFLFGKERWIVWEISSEQLQDVIKPINETIKVNCWHL